MKKGFCLTDGIVEPRDEGECPLCGSDLLPVDYVQSIEKYAILCTKIIAGGIADKVNKPYLVLTSQSGRLEEATNHLLKVVKENT